MSSVPSPSSQRFLVDSCDAGSGLSDSFTAPARAVLSLNSPSTPSTIAITCPCIGQCSCDRTTGTPLVTRRAARLGGGGGGGYGSCVVEQNSDAIQPSSSLRCHCHVVNTPTVVDKTARNKLLIACIIALLFTIGEAAGGYLAGSLAIMTDAAHMLSDFASFLISLFSIWMASRQPSKRMSFGWHRAEVVGAVISVLIIWVVTGVLVYEAVLRMIRRESNINANIMLITAAASLFVNVFMCMVLHQHTHGHGHSHGGHGHSHAHGHSHGTNNTKSEEAKEEEADEELEEGKRRKRRKGGVDFRNINVRAAFIHTIGDLVQSIGVIVAGFIIWFKPEWYFADPICTFLFSILVVISTLTVLRDALLVLMEGAPRHIDYESVKQDLLSIPGVKHVHSVHIWSLTMSKTAIAAHLALEPGNNSQDVLDNASQMLKRDHHFAHTTLQVEDYQTDMEDCRDCHDTPKNNRNIFAKIIA